MSNSKTLVNEKPVTRRFDFSDIFVFITIFIGVIIFVLSFCPWITSDRTTMESIVNPKNNMYWN